MATTATPTKPVTLDAYRDPLGRWITGNPGKPHGALNKLAPAYDRDLWDFWQDNGPELIRKAAERNPAHVLRTIMMRVNRLQNDALDDDPLATIGFNELRDEFISLVPELLPGHRLVKVREKRPIGPPARRPARSEGNGLPQRRAAGAAQAR
jgi:hypothetical protein